MLMRRLGPLAVVVVWMAACSESSDPAAAPGADAGPGSDDGGTGGDGTTGADGALPASGLAWTSGSRLRARVDTAGTARQLVGWHDSKLDIDCEFSVASDGKIRCLPVLSIFSVYDDASCMMNPVAVAPKTSTPKYLPAPNGPFVCGKGPDFFLPGASYTPTALFQFNDMCTPAGSVDPNSTYLHFGARVEPTTFVAATIVTDPRGARLAARQYLGEDGSRQDFEMQDSARANSRCAARDLQNGTYACIPLDLAYQEDFFSDIDCTALAAFHPGYADQVCDRTPTAVQDSTTASIGKPLSFFEVGAKLTGKVYRKDGTACLPYTPPASLGATFYASGAAVPLSSFASFTLKNEGTGRILLTVARTESGALGANLSFFDATKNVACNAQLAADGQRRCLPQTQTGVNVFTNDKCTDGVIENSPGVPAPAAGTLAQGQSPLRGATAMFQVGAKIAVPSMAWHWNGETCEMSSTSPTDDFYAAATVPPADFMVVTAATE